MNWCSMRMQEWLVRAGCSDADITSIKEGFKEALGKPILAVLSFRDFARTFSWFASTLHMMSQVCYCHLLWYVP